MHRPPQPSIPVTLLALGLGLLAACGAEGGKSGDDGSNGGSGDGADGADGGNGDTGSDGGDEVVLPTYSAGTCPAIVDGTNSDFPTGDTTRSFEVVLPADPVGAPVVFGWHWLGGNAKQAIRYLDLEAYADEHGAIVIAPQSDGYAYEWHFLDAPAGNPDLLLFEDLLACVGQQYAIDTDRVYAIGMSAGGLWTTYLTMYEAEWLAATAPFSGGTQAGGYDSPAWPLPVLVTWGGPSDTYSGFSFDYSSTYFSTELQADGSFVVECEHDNGHTIPPGAGAYAWRFFEDHPMGVTEAYTSGLPSDYPDWCRIP